MNEAQKQQDLTEILDHLKVFIGEIKKFQNCEVGKRGIPQNLIFYAAVVNSIHLKQVEAKIDILTNKFNQILFKLGIE